MVDRIGKGGPKPPTSAPTGAPKASETGRTFEVKKTEGADPTAATHAVSSSPLEQLKNGSLSIDGYLDAKVKEATAHLHGLSPVQLDSIRSMLRDQIASDPALAELFQQATGHAPPASDE